VDGGPGAGGFEGFGGFSDIFDAFFGGGAAGAGSARRGRPQPGADLRYDLRITFDEAVRGTDKEIEFRVLDRCETCAGTGAKPGTDPVTCPQCNGRGEVRSVRQTMLGQMVNVSACPRCRGEGRIVEAPCETCRGDGRIERKRSLRVTIPAGIDEGHQIRLTNEGEVGPRGGPPGSLYVAVHVAPHPTLKRDGTELFYEARISIAQAALGARISVPTVDGDEEVEIKPGTQPDTAIRLRGKGVPHLRRSGSRGDLHVLVDVEVPRKLSKKQRELLEQFARESGDTVSSEKGGILDKLGLG
jgi:molecular chaperone DnaJ